MIPTFVDLETYYDTDYSLTRLTTAEYILDPRFELILTSVIHGDTGEVVCLPGTDGAAYLQSLDWSQRMFIAHHTRFDGSICKWRYGVSPLMYGDSMALSEILVKPFNGSASLFETARYLHLPDKGDEVVRAKGKRLADFSPAELRAYADYCVGDDMRCREIFTMLAPLVPPDEFHVIDHMLRMFIEPRLRLDPAVLHAYLAQVEERKLELLQRIQIPDRSVLMSDATFAGMLEALGVDPPQKISPSTNLTTYAFAKTDEAFVDLLEDEDPEVVALVEARLGHKTTIEETRTQRLIDMANLTPDHWLPVPLRYGAAMTHRAGGTDKINLQNLGRNSELRRAVVCPPGHKIVTVDASQIELRLLMWLAGQEEMLELFERGDNAYIEFGVHLVGRRVTKAEVEPYTLCKISVLSCGYSVSGTKFKRTARAQSRGLLRLSEEEAEVAVKTYRAVNYQVPLYWKFSKTLIEAMHEGRKEQLIIDGQPVWTTDRWRLIGPGGLEMQYPGLRQHVNSKGYNEFRYDWGRKRNIRLFGAKLTENQCQHLARLIVYAAQLRIHDRTGYTAALQAHDELVFVVPDHDVERLKPILVEEMSRRPAWAPNLPLAAETKSGLNYLSCK